MEIIHNQILHNRIQTKKLFIYESALFLITFNDLIFYTVKKQNISLISSQRLSDRFKFEIQLFHFISLLAPKP